MRTSRRVCSRRTFKFYSARIQLTPELQTQRPGLYAIGDGAGVTRGLAQAGASGVLAARAIAARI